MQIPKSTNTPWRSSPSKSCSQKEEQLIKVTRHPTYSTIANSVTKKDKNGKEESQESSSLVPSPLESDESLSNEAKYLSFNDGDLRMHDENESGDAQFFCLLYQCAVYLKKEAFRSKVDDELIYQNLTLHLNINLIRPTPKSLSAHQMLKNGYILSAVAVATGRLHSSSALLSYYFQMFSTWHIETNLEEFQHYRDKQEWGIEQNKGGKRQVDKRREMLEEESGQQENKENKEYMLATRSSIRRRQTDEEV